MPVQEALAEIARMKPGEKISYQALAKKHGWCRSTSTHQHTNHVVPHETKAKKQLLIHPRDDVEVVEYIRGLYRRVLSPTRETMINFVTPLCAWPSSKSWVTRFLRRHVDELHTAWTTPMKVRRYYTDSSEKYRVDFELLHSEMAQYNVLPGNTYKMDEKGFAIRVAGRSKRIFNYTTKSSSGRVSTMATGSG
jgi:hypothetical protein